ncbi:MAG: TRAP transporter large permease [Pseudomonadota bacterium]
MSPLEIGVISLLGLLGLLLLGCPIGLAMALAGFLGFTAIVGLSPALAVIETAAFDVASNAGFALIPLFLLMGSLMAQAGLARDLFAGAARLTRGWPGGLAAAGLTASAGFAAVSGSSLATASTMTRIAYPEMARRAYDPRLAAGSLAAGGTLGIMIPPSIALLLYALITEQSVDEMFLAGVLPGLLAYTLYLIVIMILAQRWRPLGPKGGGAEEGLSLGGALLAFAPCLALFALIIGGLYGDVFTPTEAGGVGAGLALLFALWRGARAPEIFAALGETVRATAAIFLILIGAEIFGYVLSTSQLSFAIAEMLTQEALAPWHVLALILAFYVLLGCVVESLGMILLTAPIFHPIIVANGFDPVWFGVLAVVAVELGLITPPIGLNLFMVKSQAPTLPHRALMIGVAPFIAADILRLALLAFIPAIALWLPGRL